MTGRQIMEKQRDLHQSAAEFIEQTMVLVDDKGNKEVRALRQFNKEVEPGINRTLIAFLEPADIKGTALLTWQHKDRDDDQWLYLPARGKMQRIAGGAKKSYFMGTDFAYEDLQEETLGDFDYSLIGEENCEEKPCYLIEALPADEAKKRASGYSKRRLWISVDLYNTLKVEYYDRRGRLIKTQINRQWSQVGETAWRPDQVLMDNHKDKHKTLVGVQQRDLERKMDEQTFTDRFILSGKHVR